MKNPDSARDVSWRFKSTVGIRGAVGGGKKGWGCKCNKSKLRCVGGSAEDCGCLHATAGGSSWMWYSGS